MNPGARRIAAGITAEVASMARTLEIEPLPEQKWMQAVAPVPGLT